MDSAPNNFRCRSTKLCVLSFQLGQALTGQAIWSNLMQMYPDAIGPENAHNKEINAIFGDQGGYWLIMTIYGNLLLELVRYMYHLLWICLWQILKYFVQ